MGNEIDREFLREEYFHVNKTVEEFDQRVLIIKGWSVTVSMTAIAAAFLQKAPALFLLASGSSLLFWVIETLWKSFQVANYKRIRAIEKYMRGEEYPDFCVPDINRSWGLGWRELSYLKISFWPHVCLPHIAIVAVGLAFWMFGFANPTIKG